MTGGIVGIMIHDHFNGGHFVSHHILDITFCPTVAWVSEDIGAHSLKAQTTKRQWTSESCFEWNSRKPYPFPGWMSLTLVCVAHRFRRPTKHPNKNHKPCHLGANLLHLQYLLLHFCPIFPIFGLVNRSTYNRSQWRPWLIDLLLNIYMLLRLVLDQQVLRFWSEWRKLIWVCLISACFRFWLSGVVFVCSLLHEFLFLFLFVCSFLFFHLSLPRC